MKKNIYQLHFQSEEEAIQMRDSLMELGLTADSIVSCSPNRIVNPDYDEEDEESQPVIDGDGCWSLVMTELYVKELLPYITNDPLWDKRYSGQNDEDIVVKPTGANTKDEIKAFLDLFSVSYTSDATKAELLNLIN